MDYFNMVGSFNFTRSTKIRFQASSPMSTFVSRVSPSCFSSHSSVLAFLSLARSFVHVYTYSLLLLWWIFWRTSCLISFLILIGLVSGLWISRAFSFDGELYFHPLLMHVQASFGVSVPQTCQFLRLVLPPAIVPSLDIFIVSLSVLLFLVHCKRLSCLYYRSISVI